MACRAETSTLHVPDPSEISLPTLLHIGDYWLELSSDEMWLYISASLALVMVLCAVICVMSCCLCRKANRLQQSVGVLQLMVGAQHTQPQANHGYDEHSVILSRPPSSFSAGEATKLLP